ncbi:MAG TPA: OmpA family protein [Polyangiaceae bacterium]|nr:OmpA family protein [Polyangiaceae bacterium]
MNALALSACGGGTTVFQGAGAISIVGTPPAPPPPPPPKAEEPPPPPPRVEVRDNKIEFKEKIQFENNKSVILPQSFSLLDDIVKVIKDNEHIKKIAIEGHASAEGDAKRNLTLSDERAKAVMKYCVDHGIDAKRLTAKGFGITKPIADNATEEGREKNRRVEFNIVEQDVTKKKIEIDPKTGKEKLVGETKTTVKEAEPPAPAPADPAAAKKAEAEKKAADKKAEAEKKAADAKAAAEKKVADAKAAAEKKAADKKAADEKAAADKKAAEEKKAADKKAADEKAAADKAAKPKASSKP